MALPLRKIVQDVRPRSTHYEQSEPITMPTILPFKEFVFESKFSPWELISLQRFQNQLLRDYGTRNIQDEGKISNKVLGAFKAQHHTRDAIWQMCERELKRREHQSKIQELKKVSKEAELPKPSDYIITDSDGVKHAVDVYIPPKPYDRYFTYVWTEKGMVDEEGNPIEYPKFGDRWVKAGEKPVEDIQNYIRSSLSRTKYKFGKKFKGGHRIEIIAYTDVSEYAKQVKDPIFGNKFHKNAKIDTFIADEIGLKRLQVSEKNPSWDVYDMPTDLLITEVNKHISEKGQPLRSIGLAPWQAEQANLVIEDIEDGKRIIGEELCPRFGKTTWALSIAKERKTPVTIIGSYVLSSLSSFKKELSTFEDFKNFEAVDTSEEGWEDRIEEARKNEKQVVALLSLCGDKGEPTRIEKYKSLFGDRFTDEQKMIFIDEADFGAHQPKQTKILQKFRNEDDPIILMSGTSIDKATKHWDVESVHHVSYFRILEEKFKRLFEGGSNQKQPKFGSFNTDPSRADIAVPIVGIQLSLKRLFERSEEFDPESWKNLQDNEGIPSWTIFAKDPDKSHGFFRNMLRSMYLDAAPAGTAKKLPELNVKSVINEVNEVAKNKGVPPEPRRVMMFLPGGITNINLDKARKIAEDALGPNWVVKRISGKTGVDEEGGWDNTTNAKAEKDVNMAIKIAGKKKNVLILSAGMGSRSFSSGAIHELVLAYDGGSVAATIQKMSRVLTPDIVKKVGYIWSLSLNPNRDDKFAALKSTAVDSGLKAAPPGTQRASIRRRVNDVLDLFAVDPEGFHEYDDSQYIKNLYKTNNFGRVIANRAPISLIPADYLSEILRLNIRSAKAPKQPKVKKGRTYEKVLPPLALARAHIPNMKTSDEQKIREFIAGVSDPVNFRAIRAALKKGEGKAPESLDNAMQIIKQNRSKYRRKLSGHFMVDFDMINGLYDIGVIDNDLADRAYTESGNE